MKSKSSKFSLSRRAVLRGMGGAVVSLPVLDCMLDSNGEALAQGAAKPKRYGIVFAGQALGGDGWERDRYMVGAVRKQEAGHFIVPAQVGAAYTTTTPLKPLEKFKGDFNVISGLNIPFNANSTEGAMVPPGGAYRDFHGGGCSPLLSGMRSTSSAFSALGISSDQVIAALPENKGKTLIESLVVRAQPSWYLGGSSYSGREFISYAAARKPVVSQTNPQTVFQALFNNFMPTGQDQTSRADFDKRAEQAVLGLVTERRRALVARVGAADKQRLEAHFDQISELQKRVGAVATAQTATCSKPMDPGNAWAIGGDNAGSGGAALATNTGYSDETKRAQVMADLIHMAFVCDLTRVATLQITTFQSHMNVAKISQDMGTPVLADLHEVGHNGDPNNKGQLPVSLMLQWHIAIYARLIEKLKASAEGPGTALDSTSLVLMPEAGHGRQLNDGKTDFATHSVENMILLVAGRAGGMKPGRHIAATGKHPAAALLSAMKGAGFNGDTLGEVTGPLPDLFS